MLTGIGASHLSALIAEVREEEERLNYATKEGLLALAEYMTGHRPLVEYSFEEDREAIQILQNYHLGRLIARPDLIEQERRKPWIAKCRRCGRTLTAPESVARGIGPVCHKAPSRRARGKGKQVVPQTSGWNKP